MNFTTAKLALTYRIAPFLFFVPVLLISLLVYINLMSGRVASYERWYVLFGMIVVDLVAISFSYRFTLLPIEVTTEDSSLKVKKFIGEKTFDLTGINKIYGSFFGLRYYAGNPSSSWYPPWLEIYFNDGSSLRFALGSFSSKNEQQAILKSILPYIKKPELYGNSRAGELISDWEKGSIFSL